MLLCFSETNDRRRCRSLRRKNDGQLSSITDFEFGNEFDTSDIVVSTHDHWMASLANYQGFPLVLGGTNNNKLEMLDTTKNPSEWVEYEGTDYPYQNEYVGFSLEKFTRCNLFNKIVQIVCLLCHFNTNQCNIYRRVSKWTKSKQYGC